mgnify:CR=1 FL=1
MARTSTYLNFPRNPSQAFLFYKSVFGGDFRGGVARFSDIPPHEGAPPPAEADQALVMHIELPILGGARAHGHGCARIHGFQGEHRE